MYTKTTAKQMLDKFTDNRRKYAQYSDEDLNKLKIIEIRKIASSVGVSKINRQTEKGISTIIVYNCRKAEAIEAIKQACSDSKTASTIEDTKAVAETELATEIPLDNEIEYEFQSNALEIERLVKKYYSGIFIERDHKSNFLGLKDYVTKLVAENRAFHPIFMSVVAPFKSEIEQLLKDRTGDINQYTILNWKSTILKEIEELVDQEDHQFPDKLLKKTFASFYESIQCAFEEYKTQKYQKSNTRLNQRQNNTIEIAVTPLINWARNRLINLPEMPSRWTEVAVALMVVTGRRQSEIMSSAQFQHVGSDSYLEFSGQLKKHKDENSESYEIPILGKCAEAVISGINWLNNNNKRVIPIDRSMDALSEAAKKSHSKYSRYVGQEAKSICDKFIILGEGYSWINENKDRRIGHLFRQIYGQCVYPVFYEGSNQKLNQVLTEVMGHSNLEGSLRHAATAYDADCEVTDIPSVKLACGK